jgi:hypothetical protein
MTIGRDLQALLGSDGNVAALERLYDRTIERILRELAAGVSRPGAGRARDSLIRIRELASELNPKRDTHVRDWIRRELPKAFILGDKDAAKAVARELEDAGAERVGDVKVNRTFTAVNSTALSALVASMTARLEDVHRQVLQTAGLVVRNTQLRAQTDAEVREHIVDGIVRGATGREVSNDIARAILTGKVPPAAMERMRAGGHAGDVALYKALAEGQFITVGKKRFNVRAYANLVARSMSRQAATVGTKLRLQQSGVFHVQMSNPSQTEPDICTPYAGKVFWIGAGEDPAGFPALSSLPGGDAGGVPPFHPNCRHTISPYVLALRKPVQVESARALSARLKSEGFLGIDADKVQERVEAMDPKALDELSPGVIQPGEEPGPKPKEAA